VILGVLVYRSGYIPKAVGVLMTAAGACYLINSFAQILSPSLQNRLLPAILIPALVGELSFALWLLFQGVRAEPWERRVRALLP
jgi:hypothetical protein